MGTTDDATTTSAGHETATWSRLSLELGHLTTDECARVIGGPDPVLILPVGSTEPHGPHLPLATDLVLAMESARRAARELRLQGMSAAVAPGVAYGVTNYASGFAGAISLSPSVLESLIRELCVAYRAAGFALVCVTNHHLEPEHVTSLRRAVDEAQGSAGGVIFADQLSKRWGRTLSVEFKRGECHAGSYETSLVMAAQPKLVRDRLRRDLPTLSISLAKAIREGKSTFREIGMDRAYTGAPADASRSEGDELYERLTTMIVTEVREALGK